MVIEFNKEQIAVFLKNQSVQTGIYKESRDIKLPDMNTTEDVMEYIGSVILNKLAGIE